MRSFSLVGGLLLLGFLLFEIVWSPLLPWFLCAWVILFFLLGVGAPGRGVLILVFLLPLVPILPLNLGVRNFSLLEIGWLSVLAGHLCFSGRDFLRVSLTPLPAALYFCWSLVFCFSAMFLMIEFNLFNEIFLGHFLEDLKELYTPTQGYYVSSLHYALLIAESWFFFLAVRRLSDGEKQLGMRLLFCAALLAALYGYLQYVFRWNLLSFWEAFERYPRVNATFPDPNSAGTFLVISLFIGLLVLKRIRSRLAGIISLAGLILMVLVLLLTRSRTAILAAVLLLMLWVWLSERRWRKFSRAITDRHLYVMAILVLLVVLAAMVFILRVAEDEICVKPSLTELNQLLRGRLNLWCTALRVWRAFPLFGMGTHMFFKFLPFYRDMAAEGWNPEYEHPHSYFLQMAAELGLVGLLCWCFLLLSLLYYALKNHEGESLWMRKTLLCCLCAVILCSIGAHPLLVPELLFLFALLCGLIVGKEIKQVTETGGAGIGRLRQLLLLGFVGVLVVSIPFRVYQARERRPLVLTEYTVGLYAWERDEQGMPFRWSSGKSIVYLRRRGKALRMKLRSPVASGQALKVSVRVDDNPEQTFSLRETEWREIILPFHSQPMHASYLRMQLKTDRTWVPRKLNPASADERRLGVAVSYYDYLQGD